MSVLALAPRPVADHRAAAPTLSVDLAAVAALRDRLAAEAAALAATGVTVSTAAFDVTDERAVEDGVAHLVERVGPLHVLVSSAGTQIRGPFTEFAVADWDRVIATNARGALLVIKYAARSMIGIGRGGSIVNVSSQASLVALGGHISYGSSKAALDNITRASALELGRHGIRVNGVNPTVVMTPMSAWYWGREDVQGPFLEAMPLGRWATEAEIAAPIVFLLGDGASMITGVSLPVDGGYSSR